MILLMGVLATTFNVGLARAEEEPSLVSILNTLGFTNIRELSAETFVPGTYEVTLYAEFAAFNGSNELSWYPFETCTYNMIFSGPEGNYGYVDPPIEKSFTSNTKFGLSFLSPEARYFTETYRNPDGIKHAMIYTNLDDPDVNLIGFENHLGGGDNDFNDMVISLELISPTVVNINGKDWYYKNAQNGRALVFLDGGYAYYSAVKVLSWDSPYGETPEKALFINDLVQNGFDALVNKDDLYYDGSQTWIEDAAQWLWDEGYISVFLFGFSAGGVVVAYEIQKEYASTKFSAAVFASAPVDWEGHAGIFQSADTADQAKVATCQIEGEDDPYRSQMLTYYNNMLVHKEWHNWNGGHDIFVETCKDHPGEDAQTAVRNWFNAAHPPNTPLTPSGPTSGYTYTSYTYSTSTVDPNDDDVRYQFSWGDGLTTTTGWYESGSTASATHSWTSAGTYYVKVRAEDPYGAWSCWSESLEVNIATKPVNLVIRVPQAPPEGVKVWIDSSVYTAYENTPVSVTVAAGEHTIEAQHGFIKEEWMPGWYYIYRFHHWSDGSTSNPRTITLTSDKTLTAYYLRSKWAIC